MKKISFLISLVVPVLFLGCSKDFLDRPPLDRIVDANYYQTSDEVIMGTANLYNVVWWDYNDQASFALGDARGGALYSGSNWRSQFQFTSTSVEPEIAKAWKSFYNIVGQANTIIKNINTYASSEIPESVKRHAIGEARFMRGLAYAYLVRNWGPIPIIVDNNKLLADTSLSRNTVESVWEFIIRDFKYAAKVLPPVPIQKGRLTKYSAEGMLAKMYLTKAGLGRTDGNRDQNDLDSAKFYAKNVILYSGASLMDNYPDLFMTRNNNNPESLFALQWVWNGSLSAANSQQAYLAFNSSITGFTDGWGSDHGATADILKLYERADTIRRKATYMFPLDHYSYLHQLVPDPLDPTKQIAQELTLPSSKRSRANIKKYVVGLPMDNDGKGGSQRTEINTYMLRLAEVYLIYAEAILGNSNSTSDMEALKYYNAVRQRVKLQPKMEITFDDIFNEKRIEFAMEGVQWYEYVRVYYFNPQKVLMALSAQDKGAYSIEVTPNSNPRMWTITYNPKYYPVDAEHFYVPYPSVELTKAPNLRKEPIPFDFSLLID